MVPGDRFMEGMPQPLNLVHPWRIHRLKKHDELRISVSAVKSTYLPSLYCATFFAMGSSGTFQGSQLHGEMKGFRLGCETIDLTGAKLSHLSWRGKVARFIDGEATIDARKATDHHACDFGCWYYGSEGKKLRHLNAMREIETPHAKLHEAIKQVMQHKQRGETEMAEAVLHEINSLSKNVVELLDRIEHDSHKHCASPSTFN